MTLTFVLAAGIAYLLGSISFGVLVSKLAYKDDVRHHGSGNAGMTNTLRIYGGKAAALVFVGDFLKGVAAVWLAGLLWGRPEQLVAAVAVIVGHMLPLFFGFKGGKGVATGAGAILALNPIALLVLLVPFLLLLATTRYMSLASITAAALFPIVTAVQLFVLPQWGVGGGAGPMMWWELATSALMGGLVVYLHRANIGRLLAGTESKLGQKAKK